MNDFVSIYILICRFPTIRRNKIKKMSDNDLNELRHLSNMREEEFAVIKSFTDEELTKLMYMDEHETLYNNVTDYLLNSNQCKCYRSPTRRAILNTIADITNQPYEQEEIF